jgi:putative phosphoesterase
MKIAVISDTHVPDRAQALHPALIGCLKALDADLILHAGDISTPAVLTELEAIAPVKAVRGNRDLLYPGGLATVLEMDLNGIPVALTHGHLDFLTYTGDKIRWILRGYDQNRVVKRLGETLPKARVIIFGHTHRAENIWIGERLFFNPGSAATGDPWVKGCSYGLLEINEAGKITSRIIPLEGFQLVHRKWKAL